MTELTVHTEMKACPFCGDSQPEVVQMTSFDERPPRQWTRTKCQTCGAMAPSATWNARAHLPDEKRTVDCDVCAKRPSVRTVTVCGTETRVCEECGE